MPIIRKNIQHQVLILTGAAVQVKPQQELLAHEYAEKEKKSDWSITGGASSSAVKASAWLAGYM